MVHRNERQIQIRAPNVQQGEDDQSDVHNVGIFRSLVCPTPLINLPTMTKVRIRRHRHDRSLLRVVMAAVGVIGIGIVLVPWTVSLTDTPPPLALASPRVKTMQVDIKVKQDVPPTEPKESVRNPGVEISDKRRTGRDTYHTVISTGCSTFQDWQSYVFFFHLLHSGQEGPVTRIASGCSEEDAHTLTDIFEKEIATMAPGRFRLHLTPDFSRIKRGTTFKYVRDYMF